MSALVATADAGTGFGLDSDDFFVERRGALTHDDDHYDDGSTTDDASLPDDASEAGSENEREQRASTFGDLHKSPSMSHAVGLVWHAQVVRKSYSNKRNCRPDGSLKPRRPLPMVHAEDFFGSLECVEGHWVRRAPLNGWPSLTNLELVSITGKVRGMTGVRIKRYWNSGGGAPAMPKGAKVVRVTLRARAWTAAGYSQDSPGFAYWFQGLRSPLEGGPRMLHGTRMVHQMRADLKGSPPPTVLRAHHIAHRYAKSNGEGLKDKVLYHALVLLEWSHGEYCTVAELAWLNGVGGYGGRCNWESDIESIDPPPAVFRALPPCMMAPWRSNSAEIRVYDVPSRSLEDFMQFIDTYTAPCTETARFLHPEVVQSVAVELTHRSQLDVARYLLNYIGADKHYSEESRNCQTFAADFMRLVTGKDVVPYHPLNRVLYRPHPEYFMYDQHCW